MDYTKAELERMNWLDLIELVLKLQAERNELRQALVESLEDEAYVDDLR